MKRIYSIDLLRGIVIILMALDHVRDLLHIGSISSSPTDLDTTTPALFTTRWITHLCAPAFVFLSGTSAYLSMQNRADLKGTKSFLLKRGAMLILLDLTLINFGIWFDLKFNIVLFNVVAAIGMGFILLSLCLHLTSKKLLLIGLSIIFLHNLLSLIAGASPMFQIFSPLFAPASFPIGGNRLFIIGYPPIPWFGILLIGFAMGKNFLSDTKKQTSVFLKTGSISIGLFLILRIINSYGDSIPWKAQRNELYSLFSFINVSKYPPSLQYTLLFLGILFLLFAVLHTTRNQWTNRICIYGQVPLFFFIVHWYIIHLILFLVLFLQGYQASDLVFGFNFGRPDANSGVHLWAIYVIWFGVVLVLYPICKKYGRYKASHKELSWLRYV